MFSLALLIGASDTAGSDGVAAATMLGGFATGVFGGPSIEASVMSLRTACDFCSCLLDGGASQSSQASGGISPGAILVQ